MTSNKKYTFTDETIDHNGIQLRRIKRVSDGVLGGFIEKEENLSQEGNCWVDENARVYENAWVFGNARVFENAWVFGNARVYGNTRVYGNAWVRGNALVYEDTQVHGNALVYGDTQVHGNALVYGDAQVYGNAQVYEDAQVYGDARVSRNAQVYGDARVYGNAWVREEKLTAGKINGYPSIEYIRMHMGILPNQDGYYKLYKLVTKELRSSYDNKFTYHINQWAVAEKVNKDPEVSCGGGLHVSTPSYWDLEGGRLLECYVHIDDVLAAQDGKLRVRKLFVRREVFINQSQ